MFARLSARDAVVLGLAALLATTFSATGLSAREFSSRTPGPIRAIEPERALVSSSTAGGSSAKAVGDTLWIFGGPGTEEGKFQSGLAASRQGWTSIDETQGFSHWQISSFNAENLNANGPGNQAAWCGQTAAQQPGWVSGTGYGNDWNDGLLFEIAVSDPAVGQTIGLDFFHNLETEDGFDFFEVQYDSAGAWTTVYAASGTNRDASGVFPAPGIQYASAGARPIVYAGQDYSFDSIRIRIRVITDGAWSDEDGLFASDAGAVQFDDVTVSCSEGMFFDDFESGWGNWKVDLYAPAGDFFDVYPLFEDIDPCASNATPMAGFIDYGQDVNNSQALLDLGLPTSTGGSLSIVRDYGIPGHWVVNTYGGFQYFGGIENSMISPPIALDVPGPGDDASEFAGLRVRYDLWADLPLIIGIFYTWSVRSGPLDSLELMPWKDRGYVYYVPGDPKWLSAERDVSDLVDWTTATHMQVRLGVVDLSWISDFFSRTSTPSPIFDNVAVQKYRLQGPMLSTLERYLAQDGFPPSGSIDVSTPTARNTLDVPFDMALDVADGGMPITPGDSVVVTALPVIPGSSLADLRMVWALDRNPLFEDEIRTAPDGPWDENVVAPTFPATQWTGEVRGQRVDPDPASEDFDRWFFDLPDVDFLYPGDRLRYYFRATDDAARISTLPAATTGFLTGDGYDPRFQVRALPSILDAAGGQPSVLVVNGFGHEGGENELYGALDQLGLRIGEEIDVFTKAEPDVFLSNGIGSAGGHGATAGQLNGYETIVYLSGDLEAGQLSDGSSVGSNDKSDDLGLLTAWHALPGDRSAAFFGDNLVSWLDGTSFLASTLGVTLVDPSVRDWIAGQQAPKVLPMTSAFQTEFVGFDGCRPENAVDAIAPLGGAVAGHGFEIVGSGGATYAEALASVVYDRLDGSDRKIDVTFPFAFHHVREPLDELGTGVARRALLLAELLEFFGQPSSGPQPTNVPVAHAATLSVHPSPFNPRTTVRLSLPKSGPARVDVFDLRGRRVRSLHRGELDSGPREWRWDGLDDEGRSVASGVYVVRASGSGFVLQKKAVLLK